MAQATDIVTYQFRLNDTLGRAVANLPITLQYFKAATRTWEEVNRGTIINGIYSFSEMINRDAYSVFIRESIVPEIRIIATPPVYNLGKPEVLAFICQFSVTTTTVNNVTTNNFLFNFGTGFLVEKATAQKGDSFSDFIVITSLVPLANEEDLKKQIEALKKNLETCQVTGAQLLADNQAKAEQIAALNIELEAKNATVTSLHNQLVAALSQLEQKTLAVTRLEGIKQELEATIGTMQEQIDLLQQQLSIDSRPVPVSTLYSQLVQEIDTSTQNNIDGNYKLANISLKLKTLITRDENGVNAQLFDLSTMDQINGGAVSEIVFDIAPNTTQGSQTGTMPNLLGLTETAVRRILTSIGLRLNPVFQNNQQVIDGDSFKQTPAEGATYNANDFVTVIFSKHE